MNHKCICEQEAQGQKILVIGGWNGIKETTEVIDLENGNFTCTIPPVQIGGHASGGIINGIPLVCGGQIEVEDRFSNIRHCFKFQNNTWTKIHTLPRDDLVNLGTGDLIIKNQLLLSGMENNFYSSCNNELIGLNSTSKISDIPVDLDSHCITRLNESHFMTTGGYSYSHSMYSVVMVNLTYFYNIETDIWSPGPPLNHPRIKHGCSMITLNGLNYVVVLGSGSMQRSWRGSEEAMNSFEYLSLSDIEAGWTDVKLSMYFGGNTLIRQNNNNGFYIVSNRGIHDLVCNGDQSPQSCQLMTIENTRADFDSWGKTIIPIDENLANELCPSRQRYE